MEVIKTAQQLDTQLNALRNKGKRIGFVPTMGALHQGHASLVERSVQENDITVVSVFVNPTQFNDPKDLENYPRTLEAECALLENMKVDFVFAPTAAEMYPEPDTRTFSYPPIDSVMEGPRRPGHFNGVCQVVSKLFDMVRPHRAYFGEKDFQQIAVIRAMVPLPHHSRRKRFGPQFAQHAAHPRGAQNGCQHLADPLQQFGFCPTVLRQRDPRPRCQHPQCHPRA